MPHAFSQSVTIAATPQRLFDFTQDYEGRLAWDPFLKRAELIDAEAPEVGVRALCVARNGLAMVTEYVAFQPPHGCAVRMTRGPQFIRRFAGSWRFREIAPGRTQVRFRYLVEGRPRWLTPLLRRVFARSTRRRLAALERAMASS